MRARFYDPETGTFLSVDPVPSADSAYAYCANNPLAAIDPSGCWPKFLKSAWSWVKNHAVEIGVTAATAAFDAAMIALTPVTWGASDALAVYVTGASARWLGSRAAAQVAEGGRGAAPRLLAKVGDETGSITLSRVASTTGQNHHAISTRIGKALAGHPNLAGKYALRDSRFITQAANREAHIGYQKWHRELDNEVAQWIRRSAPETTTEQFESYLRNRYAAPDLIWRFPHGF